MTSETRRRWILRGGLRLGSSRGCSMNKRLSMQIISASPCANNQTCYTLQCPKCKRLRSLYQIRRPLRFCGRCFVKPSQPTLFPLRGTNGNL